MVVVSIVADVAPDNVRYEPIATGFPDEKYTGWDTDPALVVSAVAVAALPEQEEDVLALPVQEAEEPVVLLAIDPVMATGIPAEKYTGWVALPASVVRAEAVEALPE